jgi:hypothetical protein
MKVYLTIIPGHAGLSEDNVPANPLVAHDFSP